MPTLGGKAVDTLVDVSRFGARSRVCDVSVCDRPPLVPFRLANASLFVFTYSLPFWGISWREILRSWGFPTGQLTVEFTVKFLRQDHNLRPVPGQNAAPTVAGEA